MPYALSTPSKWRSNGNASVFHSFKHQYRGLFAVQNLVSILFLRLKHLTLLFASLQLINTWWVYPGSYCSAFGWWYQHISSQPGCFKYKLNWKERRLHSIQLHYCDQYWHESLAYNTLFTVCGSRHECHYITSYLAKSRISFRSWEVELWIRVNSERNKSLLKFRSDVGSLSLRLFNRLMLMIHHPTISGKDSNPNLRYSKEDWSYISQASFISIGVWKSNHQQRR